MSDDIQKYNHVARVFHWSVAALILGLLFVGYYMDSMDPAPLKFQIYGYHKALGVAVLLLVGLRIMWRVVSKTPAPLSSHKTWEKYLSRTIHIVLYLTILAMPISGWVMSSAGGYPVSFFGWFELPALVEKNKELGKLANQTHGVLAFIIIGAVALHIVGALKHHFIDKDATLNRMSGHVSFALVGLVILAAAFYFPVAGWIEDSKAANAVANESVQGSVENQE